MCLGEGEEVGEVVASDAGGCGFEVAVDAEDGIQVLIITLFLAFGLLFFEDAWVDFDSWTL